jgi:CO/xanthine dehydrogenase FAD-binding subunit
MPSAEAIAAAADAAREAADPSADTRGSVEYKKEMAAVLVRRALLATFARLGVEGLR